MADLDYRESVEPDGSFRTTHWTVVLLAKGDDTRGAAEGLSKICETYWPPIYAFLRRQGYQRPEAEDLTQGFFAHIIKQDFLSHIQPGKGKFRSFLLKSLKNFCANVYAKTQTEKRGGKGSFISLEQVVTEEDHVFRTSKELTPEEAFDRRWAEALMQRSITLLRQEYLEAGKGELFEYLKDVQAGERGAAGYAEIGSRLGLSEGAIKTAVHRLRLRHRNILRGEIAATLDNPGDVEEEIRHLVQALSR